MLFHFMGPVSRGVFSLAGGLDNSSPLAQKSADGMSRFSRAKALLSSASPTKAVFVLLLEWINNFAMQSYPCLNPVKNDEQYLEGPHSCRPLAGKSSSFYLCVRRVVGNRHGTRHRGSVSVANTDDPAARSQNRGTGRNHHDASGLARGDRHLVLSGLR